MKTQVKSDSGVTRAYGCVDCQKIHREDIEPELFKKHIMAQSKHGWYWLDIPKQEQPEHELSDCCGSEAKQEIHQMTSGEQLFYMVCTQCWKPCNTKSPNEPTTH